MGWKEHSERPGRDGKTAADKLLPEEEGKEKERVEESWGRRGGCWVIGAER